MTGSLPAPATGRAPAAPRQPALLGPVCEQLPACIHAAVNAYAKAACFEGGIPAKDRPDASLGSETLMSGGP